MMFVWAYECQIPLYAHIRVGSFTCERNKLWEEKVVRLLTLMQKHFMAQEEEDLQFS